MKRTFFVLIIVLFGTIVAVAQNGNRRNPLVYTTWSCQRFTIDFDEKTYVAYNIFGRLSAGYYTFSEGTVTFQQVYPIDMDFAYPGRLSGGRLIISNYRLTRE